MRALKKLTLGLLLTTCCSVSYGALAPETIGQFTMGDPTEEWILVKDVFGPAYVFDGASGEMQGLLSLTNWTPGIQTNVARKEIYAAESYYSRDLRGDREDVLTVYDFENLAPVAEIDIPDKVASLPFSDYIALLGDGRHLTVFNMTPATSVSIIDVVDREFVTELSTPGCALTMASGERGFLMMCGDGTLQLIELDRNGQEARRARSEVFFSVEDDPVYDRPMRTQDGWLMMTFGGKLFHATVNGRSIDIEARGSILGEGDTGWLPGGHVPAAYHADSGLLATVMHQGGVDTHEHPGTEIWIFNGKGRRIGRLQLDEPVTDVHLSASDSPTMYVLPANPPGRVLRYDPISLRNLGPVEPFGASTALIQSFENWTR